MANRSYLYALSNQPTRFSDRPETIQGLSEWPYAIPFSYYLLVSGNTRLSASLLEEDSYALTGDFSQGIERFERFANVVRNAVGFKAKKLTDALSSMSTFLSEHKDRYFLLETFEMDWMVEGNQGELAKQHLARAQAIGQAIDAFSRIKFWAAFQLLRAVESGTKERAPFKGLVLSDAFDDSEDHPMGIEYWNTVLFYEPWNRAKCETHQL